MDRSEKPLRTSHEDDQGLDDDQDKKGKMIRIDHNADQVKSIRIDDATERLILKKYQGSIQTWIDHCIKVEFNKQKNIEKAG